MTGHVAGNHSGPASPVPGAPSVSHSVVEEMERYTQSVSGVRVEAVRVGPGRGPTLVNAVVSPDYVATECRTGIPTLNHTTIDDNRLIVARISAAEPGSSWCGIDLVPGLVLIYAPGAEHAGIDRPGLEFAFVATHLDRLHELADRLRLSLRLPARGSVSALTSPSRAEPVARAFNALSAAMRTDDFVSSPMGEDVMCAMVGAVADSERSLVVGRGRRLDNRVIVRACFDYAESIQRIPSIGELCLAAHVSERRLREAFADQFDMPPTRTFRAWALDMAHRRLRTSEADGMTVARAAADVGLYHLGRFAAHYRMVYGQLPSRTLQETTATSARAVSVG